MAIPAQSKMIKLPNSFSSYLFSNATGTRTTMAKAQSPKPFTQARVHFFSRHPAAGIKCAVAPTSNGAIDTVDASYRPFNASGSIDLNLWQSSTLPDLTAGQFDPVPPSNPDYLISTVSDWLDVEAIPDANSNYNILIRLQITTGEFVMVGNRTSEGAVWGEYLGAQSEPYYQFFVATADTRVTDAFDYTQVDTDPLTSAGFTHLFAVEFGFGETVDLSDSPSLIALGDSITADAETNPYEGLNIWPLVSLGNAANDLGSGYFFTNAAMSSLSEKDSGYAAHYRDIISHGVKFDYVFCPAFTPNGGAPNATRETEQKAWLDELVAITQTEGSKLILWEGIPNETYAAFTDAFRVAINDYGRQLAVDNEHVTFLEVGSQVSDGATPERTLPQYVADDFHLNNDGNDVLAAYTESQFRELMFNAGPVANAGPDQSVAAGATVQLDGTGSTDSDGTIVNYAWAQAAGDTVTLTGANTATPSFTAPSTNASQALTFELTVTDDGGLTGTDSVDVQVAAQVIESTLNATLTGIADGAYLTRVVDTDNDTVLFKDNKEWANGASTFTLPVAVGTNVEYYAYETTNNGAGLQIGVTE